MLPCIRQEGASKSAARVIPVSFLPIILDGLWQTKKLWMMGNIGINIAINIVINIASNFAIEIPRQGGEKP